VISSITRIPFLDYYSFRTLPASEKEKCMGEAWGVLAAVLSSGLGGTSIGATRYLVNAIDPLAIGSFRFGIGFLLLLPVALLQGGRWPPRTDWLRFCGLGVL
jgi:drug/metabolite transporter (DMT)-like permease